MSQQQSKKPPLRSAPHPASPWLAGLLFAAALASPAGAQGKASPPPPAAALTPQASLENLFSRLAQAKSPDEAQTITSTIERLWLRSGSDTADLLMNRAVGAVNKQDYSSATKVLDKLVELEPGWAEGWNKRATVRYLENNDDGSVSDISHVLALEPRHFGALAGLGFILMRNGNDKRALQVFRRVLEVNPQLENIRKIVDRMIPEVEGREL